MNKKYSFALAAAGILVCILFVLNARRENKPIESPPSGGQHSSASARQWPAASVGAPLPKSTSETPISKNSPRRSEEIVSILPTKAPLKPNLDLFKQKAIDGDNKAALQLFVDLKNCRDIVRRGEEFVKNEQGSKDENESARAEFIKQLDNCKGIGLEDTKDVMQWLTLAARRGDSQAQIMWVDYFLDEQGGAAWMLQHPEEAQEYKRQALDYLDDLSNKCNRSALTTLFWQAYQGGPLVSQDEYKAYRYAYLMNLTAPGSVRNEELEAISSKLRGDQITSAIKSAQKTFDASCN